MGGRLQTSASPTTSRKCWWQLQPNNTECRIAFREHSWMVPVLDGSEGPWFRATPLAASFE